MANRGRPPGSTNKKTVQSLVELGNLAAEYKSNPARQLMAFAAGKPIMVINAKGEKVSVFPSLDQILDASSKLMPYLYARKSETALTGTNGEPIVFTMDMGNAGEFELPSEAATDSTSSTH